MITVIDFSQELKKADFRPIVDLNQLCLKWQSRWATSPIIKKGGGASSQCAILWGGRWSKSKSSANYRIDKTMITYGTFSPVCVWSEKSNQTKCVFEEERGGERTVRIKTATVSGFVFSSAKCMWSNRIKQFSQAERILLLSNINQVKMVSKNY